MLSILEELDETEGLAFDELGRITGLESERLRGYSHNLREDGFLLIEEGRALRITGSGKAALEAYDLRGGV